MLSKFGFGSGNPREGWLADRQTAEEQKGKSLQTLINTDYRKYRGHYGNQFRAASGFGP